uniref:Uncharacterized protein n=1 Tax=Plectus sambesii TaxID=2011161 RepID=A0A914WJ02_9BILA
MTWISLRSVSVSRVVAQCCRRAADRIEADVARHAAYCGERRVDSTAGRPAGRSAVACSERQSTLCVRLWVATTYQGARSSTRAEPALTLDSSSEHEIIIDLCSGERSAAPSDWLEEGVTGGRTFGPLDCYPDLPHFVIITYDRSSSMFYFDEDHQENGFDAPGKSAELAELDEEPAELVPLGMKTGNGVFTRRRSKTSFFGKSLFFFCLFLCVRVACEEV